MTPQQAWQSQSIDAPQVSLAYVRHVASDFERRRWVRAVLGSIACLAMCALYASLAWRMFSPKPLLMAASVCMILGMLYVLYRMYRHLTAESNPADAGVLDTLRFQRRQLVRQRDFRRRNWRWTFPALLPAYALMLASFYLENDPVPWRAIGQAVLIFLGAIFMSVVNGEWKARASQREIDALDSLASDR